MRQLTGAILLTVFVCPSVAGVHRIVPIAGHVPGANETMWTTDLMLFNSLPQQEAVRLVFRPGDGTEVSRDIEMGPGESMLIADAVDPAAFPGVNPESWIGQLEVVADGGVYVHARIFTNAPGIDAGTFGSCFPVLDPEGMLERGIISGIAQTAQYRTNIAFVNPSAMTLTFRLEVRDRSGVTVARPQVSVGPYRSLQIPFGALHGEAGDGYSIEWTSADWDAYVMASIIDNVSGDPTAAPSAPAGATSLFFPIVGRIEGAFDTHWTTSLVLTSDSAVAGSVTLDVHDNDLGTRTLTLDIAARGSVLVNDVYDALGIDGGTGFLRVSSTVPVAGYARLFNTVEGKTYGSAMLSQEAEAVNGFLHIRGVRVSSDYRFNLAVANSDFSDAGGFIRVYDDRREVVYSREFDVPARTTVQFAIPESVAVRAGDLVVQPNQNHALTAVGSNVDNHTGDTVLIEARQ